MVLKLYGYHFSVYTHLVAVVAKELSIEYELISVDLVNGEQSTPEYKAYQPFSKVPCIDDEGFILYESRAIARYLAAKTNSPLLPTELKAAALFEQAASIEIYAFNIPAGRIFWEGFIKKVILKQEYSEEIINENMALLSKNLDVYEGILSKTKYLAGDELTLADLFHLSLGRALTRTGVPIFGDPSRPNVVRWWNDISNRPAWLEVVSEFV